MAFVEADGALVIRQYPEENGAVRVVLTNAFGGVPHQLRADAVALQAGANVKVVKHMSVFAVVQKSAIKAHD